MNRLSALSKKIALAALLTASAVGLTTTASARDRWHHNHRSERVVERCDAWGRHCHYYRCDWDGDCYRIGGPAAYGPPPGYYYERYEYGPPPPRGGVSLGVRIR